MKTIVCPSTFHMDAHVQNPDFGAQEIAATEQIVSKELLAAAVLSDCRTYRYQLTRRLGDSSRTVMWLMMNPSTADAMVDDPTIRRCISFSKGWGFGRMFVCNLYAFRSPTPADLWRTDDPIGSENDRWIVNTPADVIVCAWGANAKPERINHVMSLLGAPATCLGKTKDGFPRHPLYVKSTTPLETYSWRI